MVTHRGVGPPGHRHALQVGGDDEVAVVLGARLVLEPPGVVVALGEVGEHQPPRAGVGGHPRRFEDEARTAYDGDLVVAADLQRVPVPARVETPVGGGGRTG